MMRYVPESEEIASQKALAMTRILGVGSRPEEIATAVKLPGDDIGFMYLP